MDSFKSPAFMLSAVDFVALCAYAYYQNNKNAELTAKLAALEKAYGVLEERLKDVETHSLEALGTRMDQLETNVKKEKKAAQRKSEESATQIQQTLNSITKALEDHSIPVPGLKKKGKARAGRASDSRSGSSSDSDDLDRMFPGKAHK